MKVIKNIVLLFMTCPKCKNIRLTANGIFKDNAIRKLQPASLRVIV